MARRALLLGIPDYDDDDLKIEAATNDVQDLATALKIAGFPDGGIVHKCRGLTTTRMRSSIAKFFEEADSCDDLLVYYSGHGVDFEGKRLLVPLDFDQRRPVTVAEMLSDLDVYALARSSPAASIVVFLDACRVGVELRLAPSTDSKGIERLDVVGGPDTPSIAIVHSCEDDKRSYFERGKEGRSHFTDALCRILRQEQGPANLDEIFQAIRSLLTVRGTGQVPMFGECISGRSGSPKQILVKENVAARIMQQIRDSRWCGDLLTMPLFRQLSVCHGLQRQLEVIVLRCEEAVLLAVAKVPDQRWRPSDPVKRVFARLPIFQIEPSFLCPPEVALLLAAPYVYEAVLSLAELRLCQDGDPLAPPAYECSEGIGYMSRAWRTAFVGDERWRRRRDLVQRGDIRYTRDVAAWQLLRFLHNSGELWQVVTSASDRRDWLGNGLAAIFEQAPFAEVSSDSRVSQILSGERVVRLARLMFCDHADVEIAYGGGQAATQPRFEVGEGAQQWEVDERKVAHMLSLLARTGLDARRLSESPAEHVGIDPEVDADAIVRSLEGVEWHCHKDGSISLALECFHQALDYALELEVAAIDGHLQRLRDEAEAGSLWAQKFPVHADIRDLTPQVRDGRRAYDRPHVRFHLDAERIRDLLMGPKLYGDPRYALREAYQNALDACRYRRAREDYFQRKNPSEEVPWLPKIVIRSSTDERGRPFVECEDNGIGMERRHLEGLFALAGRRFADTHEFHLEKASWDEAGVPFWSNSRFGIGVLAYFMLADEVVVWSRRMSDVYRGPSERCIVARILGGSDLFRVGEESGACPAGGTRVRLYLDSRPPEMRGTRLLDSIGSWLALPEVTVQLVDDNRVVRTFRPGEVSTPEMLVQLTERSAVLRRVELFFPVGERDALGHHRIFCLLPAVSPRGRKVRDRRGVPHYLPLADGICIQKLSEHHKGAVFVVNLKDNLAPVLSVDRNTILSWDEGLTWANAELRVHLYSSAVDVEKVTAGQLGMLAMQFPLEATRYNETLSTPPFKSRPVLLSEDVSGAFAVGVVGISQADAILAGNISHEGFVGDSRYTRGAQADVLRARLALLHRHGCRLPGAIGVLAAFDAKEERWAHLELRTRQALALMSSGLEGNAPFVSVITARHLLRAAGRWRMSVGEALEIAGPLTALGVDVPHLQTDASGLRPDMRMWELVSSEGGIEGHPTAIELVDLVGAAAEWQTSLGEALEVARPLSLLGIGLPVFAANATDIRPDERLARILSRDFDGRAPYLRAVTPFAVLRGAALWDMSIGEALDIVRPLAALDVKIPKIDPASAGIRIDQLFRELLSQDFDGMAPYVDGISAIRIVYAASKWEVSLGEALEVARPLVAFGVDIRQVESGAATMRPGDLVGQLLSRDLDGRFPLVDAITTSHLFRAAAQWQTSLADVLDIARPVAAMGIDIPDVETVSRSLRPDGRVAQLLSGVFSGGTPGVEAITPMQIVRAAAEWMVSLGEVLSIARPLTTLGVVLPQLDPLDAETVPGQRVCELLSEQSFSDDGSVKAISVRQLVRGAAYMNISLGEALDIARPFAALGIRLPEIEPSAKMLRPRRWTVSEWNSDGHPDDAWRTGDVEISSWKSRSSLESGECVSPLRLAAASDKLKLSLMELTSDLEILALCGLDVTECRALLGSLRGST